MQCSISMCRCNFYFHWNKDFLSCHSSNLTSCGCLFNYRTTTIAVTMCWLCVCVGFCFWACVGCLFFRTKFPQCLFHPSNYRKLPILRKKPLKQKISAAILRLDVARCSHWPRSNCGPGSVDHDFSFSMEGHVI